MTRLRPEDFPALVGHIPDEPIRALFTERFLRATEIYDELVTAACHRILRDVGALPPPEGTTPAAVAAAKGFPAATFPALTYLYAKLEDARIFARQGDVTVDTGRPSGEVEALARELSEKEPSAAVGAEVVTLLVEEASAFFHGQKSGEEILFSPGRIPLWIRYFSNENVLYAINNSLGAEVLTRVLPDRAEMLEVGGGCGSAAEAALRRLGGRIARYRFTEIVPTFARRGERASRAAASPATAVEAGKLDMNQPWKDQGIEPGAWDAVYSVNCFHVAPDLDFVLREAKAALKPGGAVIVSECMRPTVLFRPTYVEFVFDFLESFTHVKTDADKRPTHGFLSPQAWRRSFEAAGFAPVEILPDVDEVARSYPDFIVGAVVARSPYSK